MESRSSTRLHAPAGKLDRCCCVVGQPRCWRPAVAVVASGGGSSTNNSGIVRWQAAGSTPLTLGLELPPPQRPHRRRRHDVRPSRRSAGPTSDPTTQYSLADGTLVTQIGGRVRDRHAREQPDTPGTGDPYDLFAAHYFERRSHQITIYDNISPTNSAQAHPDRGRAPAVVAVRHQLPLRLHRPPRRRRCRARRPSRCTATTAA